MPHAACLGPGRILSGLSWLLVSGWVRMVWSRVRIRLLRAPANGNTADRDLPGVMCVCLILFGMFKLVADLGLL